ncbi:MAG: helix-turn-helix transcriptional regulator [Clostridium sp.]|nr:helix-turn-helix transcriptional regulator [Clostridium sp.]
MNQEKIGLFIAKCRREKNMTQEDLAEKLGVSNKSISRWENGKTMMDISLFEPLCNELDISIIELLNGERINDKKKDKLYTKTLINYSNKVGSRNKQVILTILFIMSLMPMLLYQFGGMRGVQEISGLIILLSPITIVSIILFFLGIWFKFKNKKTNKILGGIGVVGIVISEIYEFFTWYTIGITKDINLYNSINLAFPEFYIGLLISIIMVFIYFFIDKIVKK